MKINDYNVGKIFQDIELQLIKSMQRNLAGHEFDELVEGFKWEQWQAKKIRELRKYRKQNMAIMQSYKSTLDKATKADLRKQFLEGGKSVDSEVKKAIKGGYLTKQTPSDDFFQGNNKKLDSLIKSVNDDMTNAQTAALRKMDDVYRQTVFKAEAFTAAGASTVKQAVDMATKDFLAKGIDCITYKNGRNVNIASYARMAVRTANKRVHLMGEGERRKEWGESLVLVSQYLQCSPLCIDWQGKVYIDDVYSGGKVGDGPYPLLSTAISGDLFHPNCRHTMSTYFEGISDEPERMNESEVGENYEQTQQEAYINRNIQKYTRLKEGSVEEGNVKKYGVKVKEWKQKLAESKATRKVNPITDNAISKVSNVKIEDFTEEQNVFVQQEHKKLLEMAKTSNANRETAFILSGNMDSRIVEFGASDQLQFSSNESIHKLRHNKDLFVMHNHPGNSSYSMNDIRFFIENDNVKHLSIVKNNGQVEVLTKNSKYDRLGLTKQLKRTSKKNIKTGSDSEYDNMISKLINSYEGVSYRKG